MQFASPAVATVATEALQKACARLIVPDKVLDVEAIKSVLEVCKQHKKVQLPIASDGCPLVVIKPITRLHQKKLH